MAEECCDPTALGGPGRVGVTLLADMDSRTKVLGVAAGLLINLASPSAVTPLLLASGAFGALMAQGIHPALVMRRLLVPWYIAAVALATQLFWVGHTPLLALGPLVAHQEGLAQGILVASRVVGGTALVLTLSLTTPLAELLATARWLRFPPVLVEMAGLVYRYLFLFSEEAGRIQEAQVVRLGHSGWRRRMRSLGTLLGLVLLRSYDRAATVYEAMAVRGYRGTMPWAQRRKLTARDGKQVLLLAAALALTWLGGYAGAWLF